MTNVLLPAIWLIVLIVGLPQLSETVYTPSLADIAHALQTSEAFVEYTLTIYLFGFAIGTLLFWGKTSDKFGRKPCIIAGLLIFIAGCFGCYFSGSIKMLMISRLIQAFGGSIGSVLGQAICRDAFHGPALGKVYSATGSALALFPALGPVCGGIIAENFGWENIFIFLIIFAVILTALVASKLPETHPQASRKSISILNLAGRLARDKKVLGFGLIVAGCNGILFSYFAEGSFYLINGLGISSSGYGFSFVLVAAATMAGVCYLASYMLLILLKKLWAMALA
jgi:Bcr/CflA subfamily drug resistance transporter